MEEEKSRKAIEIVQAEEENRKKIERDLFDFSEDSLNERIKRKPKKQSSKNENEDSENKLLNQSDAEKIEKEEVVFFEDDLEQKAEIEGKNKKNI